MIEACVYSIITFRNKFLHDSCADSWCFCSDLEFDLNVNNTVGIRNTFLLRSYAYGGQTYYFDFYGCDFFQFHVSLLLITFCLMGHSWCLSADLRIRPMILVIKKWARHNQINDASKGTLSSYTLVLMVLHYLQSQSNHTHTIKSFVRFELKCISLCI